ncbi:MAG: tetraacyldisaccharide 4'-kinase [Desulfuromonadales bacterium]
MKSSGTRYWRGIANGTHTGIIVRLLLVLLAPLSLLYTFIQQLRAGFFRNGVLKIKRLPRPVVSVGNVTVGGTGKTPVTAYIARLLLEQGRRVAVISRGYGGSLEGQNVIVSDGTTIMVSASECGDEPFLLASTVPGLMVVIGTDRHAAGMLAMEQLSPEVFLLDDGFQHLRLHRDLNILLLDYTHPFGNGWTLPSGLLREPKAAAKRADLIIQTRCPSDSASAPPVYGIPFCNARHELYDCIPLSGGESFPLGIMQGQKLLAFAGIADPQAFFDGLQEEGLNIVSTIALPDHVSYDSKLSNSIVEAFHSSHADYAITTEKDGVKLKRLSQAFMGKTLLARLNLTIINPTPLKALLLNLLHK